MKMTRIQHIHHCSQYCVMSDVQDLYCISFISYLPGDPAVSSASVLFTRAAYIQHIYV